MDRMGRLAVLGLLLVACRGARPLTGAQPDGEAGGAEAGVALPDAAAVVTPPDAPITADLTVAPDVSVLPDAPADRAADLALDRSPPPDLGPPSRCEQARSSTWDSCSYVVDQHAFARYWMDMQCGRCKLTENGASRTISHCLYGDTDPPTYCVAECKDCCFKKEGSPCEIPADCCSPLVCVMTDGRLTCQKQ
jgi:hypothetical protein